MNCKRLVKGRIIILTCSSHTAYVKMLLLLKGVLLGGRILEAF